jgi:hypothetical protein
LFSSRLVSNIDGDRCLGVTLGVFIVVGGINMSVAVPEPSVALLEDLDLRPSSGPWIHPKPVALGI